MFGGGGASQDNGDATFTNADASTTTTTTSNTSGGGGGGGRYYMGRRNAVVGPSIHQRFYNASTRYGARGGGGGAPPPPRDDNEGSDRPTTSYNAQLHHTRRGGVQSSRVHFASSSASTMSASSRSRFARGSGGGGAKMQANLRYVRQTLEKDKDDDTLMKGDAAAGAESKAPLTSRLSFDKNRTSNQAKRIMNNVASQGRLIRKANSTSAVHYKIGDTDDDTAKIALLPSKPHCALAGTPNEVFDFVVKFLQQYFTCYDKDRKQLLAAYHPKALFSMSVHLNSEAAPHADRKLSEHYVRDSRNMLFPAVRQDKHFALLQQGNIATIAFLDKLPATEHDSNSLKLDMCLFMPNMITFCVTGVFKEGSSQHERRRTLRGFQRTFVAIPADNGQKMLIVNEQLIISNISYTELKKYQHLQRAEASAARRQVTMANNEPSTSAAASAPLPLPPQQATISFQMNNPVDQQVLADLSVPMRDLVLKFSHESKLTLKWARDCLEFANWNYTDAANAFSQHRSQIPNEAFLQ